MSTITAAEFTLDHGEIEALREAAFASLLGDEYDRIVERPLEDEDIPNNIGRAIRTAKRLNRFAEALRAAEAGRIEPWVLKDPDQVRSLVALLKEVGEPYLIGCRDHLLASNFYRDVESAGPAEQTLADMQALVTRLRAELGDA
jgi:hypothetical protein